jgi:hypothetical protein
MLQMGAFSYGLSSQIGPMPTKPTQPLGQPMTLGNMRSLGVRGLWACCLNRECRHEVRLCVDDYPDELEVPSFGPRMVCKRCGHVGADVRPNWLEQPARIGKE